MNQTQTKPRMTEIEEQNIILKTLCQYLLYERKQETQLSLAFHALVQERHNQYHTLTSDRKDGDESSFFECKNDICVGAVNLLKDSRAMAIEVNEFTVTLIDDYILSVRRIGK